MLLTTIFYATVLFAGGPPPEFYNNDVRCFASGPDFGSPSKIELKRNEQTWTIEGGLSGQVYRYNVEIKFTIDNQKALVLTMADKDRAIARATSWFGYNNEAKLSLYKDGGAITIRCKKEKL